jgi:signal transduction histidine kinase
MRRELTQNIAHELKTPVASILGYTETILHTPGITAEQQRVFTERTLKQAQRLTSLLTDISTLNRMDYAADLLVMERVDVSDIVNEIADETAHAFHQRKMTFSNCLPSDIIVIGNEQLLYSIFRNLIDNALAYAGEGSTVRLTADEAKSRWNFTFSDNGPGIASQHLPRIFERFFRVDKSRSRQIGGTGLGLAIVKNAVLLHGGTIAIRSQLGKGTSFDFSILKKSGK